MAELTVQEVVRGGLEATYASAAAGGDEFDNDGDTIVHVKNGGGSDCIVTLNIQKTVDGQSVTDPTVTVTAGEERFVGPFPPNVYNDSDGHMNLSYDQVTSVTVAALRVASG